MWKKPAVKLILVAIALCYIIGGLSRISFDVAVLKLLPQGLSQVEGLSLFLEHFAQPDELLITIESPDAETATRAAERVAVALQARPDLVKSVVDKPPWESEGIAELLAFQMLSLPPEEFDRITARLDPAEAPAVLADSIAELSTSFSPETFALRGYDPFRLTDGLPRNLFEQQGGGEFASADGAFRVVYVESARSLSNYRDAAEWIDTIKEIINELESGDTEIGYTGQPAFVADISGSMDREMILTGGTAFFLVGFIFWLCFRRFRPLAVLLACVALTFLLSMATAGWLLDDLTVISVGFAAVMIGLSVDYGYFVFSTAIHHPATLKGLRRRCWSNIIWTCSTTATVFLALNLSSLPGLSQLGTLVGFGVLIGAAVMLSLFAPFAASHLRKYPIALPLPAESLVTSKGFLHAAAAVTALAVLALLTSLGVNGLPYIDFSADKMRPKVSGAYDAMGRIYERLADDRNLLNLVVTGDSIEQVGERLRRAEEQLSSLKGRELSSYITAASLWPNPGNQQRNLAATQQIAAALPRLQTSVNEAGFADDAFALTNAVIRQWIAWQKQSTTIWPESPSSQWILRHLVRYENGRYLASGLVHPVPGNEERLLDAAHGEGIHLVSWGQLGRELKQTVPGEMLTVIGTLLAAVIALLAIALRSIRGVLFFLGTISVSVACLAGAISLLGDSIGLFSLAAVLLLLGTGTDYTILPLLAMQRNGGDAPAAQRELALVIILCSASSAVGFGCLGFANNLGLAELGRTCALGLAINACVSLFLMPVIWRWIPGAKNGASRK